MRSSVNIKHHWNKIWKGYSVGQWSQDSILSIIETKFWKVLVMGNESSFDIRIHEIINLHWDCAMHWGQVEVKFDRGQVWWKSSCRGSDSFGYKHWMIVGHFTLQILWHWYLTKKYRWFSFYIFPHFLSDSQTSKTSWYKNTTFKTLELIFYSMLQPTQCHIWHNV